MFADGLWKLGAFLPIAPTIQPNGGFFVNQVTVSFSDSKARAWRSSIRPGTARLRRSIPESYTGSFVLTNNANVQVIASLNGAVSGVASASFVNSAAQGGGLGLVGSYFSNQVATFNPPASLVRTDSVVNFNWNGTAPDPTVGSSNFSVRWTGSVQPQYTETYTFYTLANTGARLYINGQLLINSWSNSSPTLASATLPMVAQQLYNIDLDYYFTNTGDSVAELSWSSPSTPFAIIPAIATLSGLESAAGHRHDRAHERDDLDRKRLGDAGRDSRRPIQRRQRGVVLHQRAFD